MKRGQLRVFSLPENVTYAENICRELKAYSDLRIEQVAPGVLGKAKLTMKYALGILDEHEREEYELWRQFQREGGIRPSDLEYRLFKDSERTFRLKQSVRYEDAFLIAQIHNPSISESIEGQLADLISGFASEHHIENLEEQLAESVISVYRDSANHSFANQVLNTILAIRTLKDSIAGHINAVLPYFPFARSDRPTGREPIAARLFLDQLVSAGAEDTLSLDLHTGAIRGMARGLTMEAIYFLPEFVDYIKHNVMPKHKDIVFIAPDPGAGKLVQRYADIMQKTMGMGYKVRSYTKKDVIENVMLLGEFKDAYVILIDDEIDTGGTACKIFDLAMEKGALGGMIMAPHAKLAGDAVKNFSSRYDGGRGKLEKVIAGNTIPHSAEFLIQNPWFQQLPTERLLAKAIYNMHCGESLQDMYEYKIDPF